MNRELLINLRRLVVILLLTIALALLKLTLFPSLSWIIVFLPIILSLVILFSLAIFILVVYGGGEEYDGEYRNRIRDEFNKEFIKWKNLIWVVEIVI